jgi:hypothetical protein
LNVHTRIVPVPEEMRRPLKSPTTAPLPHHRTYPLAEETSDVRLRLRNRRWIFRGEVRIRGSAT